MITLDPKIEQYLKNTSAKKEKCFPKFIRSVFPDNQSNKDAIARADTSYAQYKKSRKFISLEKLIKNNSLDN